MEQKFLQMVKDAKKIVITSHISPDPDAISSSLLLAEILRTNAPGPEYHHVLEEHPASDFSFLHNFQKVEFAPMLATLEKYKPDLLIIVDANNYGRISRNESEQVRSYIAKNKVKTIVIDHHEEAGKDDVDLFLNEHGPAAVQEVYRLCFQKLGMVRPENYASTAMLGILGDTGRFKYYNPAHRETFSITSDLIDAGATIEQLEDKLQRYSPAQLEVVAHFMTNLSSEDNYTFSYISDEFRDTWISNKRPADDFKLACNMFVDLYIRNIEDRLWGFIIYPDLNDQHNYSVSFRSANGTQDVAAIAAALGGGGHKQAAGAKFTANSLLEALEKVKAAIEQP